MWLGILADLIAGVHFAYVAYVVLGLILIALGGLLSWRWVRNPWFRWSHFLMIGVVVVEAGFGITCPLTTWEKACRLEAGQRWTYDFPLDTLSSTVGLLSQPNPNLWWTAFQLQEKERPLLFGRLGEQGFIGRMVGNIMFFRGPDWMFTAGYIGFGALVAIAFFLVPPRKFCPQA